MGEEQYDVACFTLDSTAQTVQETGPDNIGSLHGELLRIYINVEVSETGGDVGFSNLTTGKEHMLVTNFI